MSKNRIKQKAEKLLAVNQQLRVMLLERDAQLAALKVQSQLLKLLPSLKESFQTLSLNLLQSRQSRQKQVQSLKEQNSMLRNELQQLRYILQNKIYKDSKTIAQMINLSKAKQDLNFKEAYIHSLELQLSSFRHQTSLLKEQLTRLNLRNQQLQRTFSPNHSPVSLFSSDFMAFASFIPQELQDQYKKLVSRLEYAIKTLHARLIQIEQQVESVEHSSGKKGDDYSS